MAQTLVALLAIVPPVANINIFELVLNSPITISCINLLRSTNLLDLLFDAIDIGQIIIKFLRYLPILLSLIIIFLSLYNNSPQG